MKLKSLASLILVAGFISGSFTSAEPAGARGYNEIRDERGRVRSQYADFYRVWSQLSEGQRDWHLNTTRRAFRGDNALDSMPRVLTGAEYDPILKAGVDQRARALRAFLQDHYSGQKTYLQAGFLPEDALKRIIARNFESGYEGAVKPEHIAFFYGPDIIRDRNGVFRVIEDNPGFIGGLGDLRLAYELMMKRYQIEGSKAFRHPDEFYKALAELYRAEARKFGGIPVVYMKPPYADNEDLRIKAIFKDFGIETVTSRTDRRLLVKDNGVFIQNVRSGLGVALEKVGYVIMISEHAWMDPSHPVARKRLAGEEIASHLSGDETLEPRTEARLRTLLERMETHPENVRLSEVQNALRNTPYINALPADLSATPETHGILNTALKNRVGLNYSPGVDFIGDKEFYTFVEEMVRFYLKEEPILRNIETQRFADVKTGALNEVLFQRVFKNLERYVIKKVDGRGGDAVWVGPKITREEIPALQERLRQDPGMYIVQEFTPLSRMNELIVDIRVISAVTPNKVVVTETPWGRGLPASGNGKVNLSDKGREITVLVQSKRVPLCRQVFQ